MRYFIIRLVWIIPMIGILTIIISFLSTISPELQINKILENRRGPERESNEAYYQTAHKLGLDQPLFFISVVPSSYPDTLFHLPYSNRYSHIRSLVYTGADWQHIAAFRKAVEEFIQTCQDQHKHLGDPRLLSIANRAQSLLTRTTIGETDGQIRSISAQNERINMSLHHNFQNVISSWKDLKDNRSFLPLYLPVIKWHGPDNQYYSWFLQLVNFDQIRSANDDRKVATKIIQALKWTLSLSLIALFFILIIAIPLGLKMAMMKNTLWDQWISTIVFILYSIPVFWLATLLIVFFTNTRYCSYCDIFPSIGIFHIQDNESFGRAFLQYFKYLVLPLLCLVPGSIAYVFRQMRSNAINEMDKQYVTAARARGISKATIRWKMIFPNSVYPMITLVSSILPGIFVGSLVIEYIFSIPGMGRLMYDSVLYQDWPVIKIILLLMGCITLFAYFITDILYKLVDPRVKFTG